MEARTEKPYGIEGNDFRFIIIFKKTNLFVTVQIHIYREQLYNESYTVYVRMNSECHCTRTC